MSEPFVNKYPRVLIYGMSFKPTTGGGITLYNLFKNWPSENLALATDFEMFKNESVVTRYYQLGNPAKEAAKSASAGNSVIKKHSAIKSLLKYLLKGRVYMKSLKEYPKVINSPFIKWVKEFQPDVIYAMVYRIHQIPLILAMQEETGLPLVIHYGDDWVRKYQFGILSPIGKPMFHKEMVRLAQASAVRLAISDDMSAEFEKRYLGKFHTLHNTVDLSTLEHLSRTSWDYTGNFRIMYAGTLEEYNMKELIDLCEATKGLPVEIHLYGSTRDGVHKQTLESYPQCTHKGLVTHDEILRLYPQYDLMYLPLTFNPKLLDGVRLSMPTKASEYMISKTPVLVYAHPESALTKYALKEDWAYVIKTSQVSALRKAVIELMENEELRRTLGEKAAAVAIRNHSTEANQERFVNLLCQAAATGKRVPAASPVATRSKSSKAQAIMKKAVKLYNRYDSKIGMNLRVKWFRLLGLNAGRNLKIWGKLIIEGKAENITFGNNCSINNFVMLEAGEKITIGDDVAISAFVQIHTSGADLSVKPLPSCHFRQPVVIGSNVWIGSGAIIVSGVTIGDDIVIAANSTVTKNLESGWVYGGTPAKPIKKLYEQDK